jgi:AAA15 family ATPase/GTPase
MLSCAANFSNVPETDAVYRFFDDYIVFYKYDMQSNWMGYTLNTLEENPDIKEKIINFMRRLSINIKDIEIGSEEVNFNELDLPDFLSDELRNKLLEGTISKYNVEFVYDQFRTNLEKEESSGICKLLGFLGPLLDIIENNKVLICDELEQSLHESVLYELVKLFIELSHEKNCQMFFSTHDTSLLNLDLFRRDQIWFTELKKEDRSTDLYSLAEIKNVRKDESFRKGYISGKYGAIPMLNADIADRMNRGE